MYANVLGWTLLYYISDQLCVMASFHCHLAIIKSHLGRVRDCLDQWPVGMSVGIVLSLLIRGNPLGGASFLGFGS